ncbi:MAG: hypothetical protein KatS3mg103_0789 [Phycisphaerales bacterium]|nr:MAG: hypothetical protein KatS3mg103_0789 [Phycisphaerales bacterium]
MRPACSAPRRWLQALAPTLMQGPVDASYLVSAWVALHERTGDSADAQHAVEVGRQALTALEQAGGPSDGAGPWQLHTALATAYTALGQAQQAVAHYERALELAGTPIAALLNNAAWLCTTELGEHDKAVDLARRALQAAQAAGEPARSLATYHHTLGTAQLAAGQAREALATFQAGLGLASTPSLRLGRIEALVALGRRDEALTAMSGLSPSADWTPANKGPIRPAARGSRQWIACRGPNIA